MSKGDVIRLILMSGLVVALIGLGAATGAVAGPANEEKNEHLLKRLRTLVNVDIVVGVTFFIGGLMWRLMDRSIVGQSIGDGVVVGGAVLLGTLGFAVPSQLTGSALTGLRHAYLAASLVFAVLAVQSWFSPVSGSLFGREVFYGGTSALIYSLTIFFQHGKRGGATKTTRPIQSVL